ncbi:hydrogenase nickel incorporation protein HypB [Methylosinus sp. Sm6]|uniref:hydrogenase nickel incorporation protein HypB n=1 Tax=Methylosinus sp. Sm6 TaxID=2866948 RepID=UPI001C99069C|nr:hydrogenase nickel incorporation protein HypB [Methylosinus sp. Sm6]MBY6241975.1 hydrogenase nickel incorporation protein HypB [Methylosinus sp. Sm6]
MCTVCGCGTSSVEGKEAHSHDHAHEHGPREHGPHEHAHAHGAHEHHHHEHDRHHHDHHGHDHAHDAHAHGPADSVIDFGAGPAGVHIAGMSQDRIIRIERDILGKNNDHARENRAHFAESGTFALNFVSSPGSGKTELLVRTIRDMKDRLPIAVIEGDQQTSNDAERIRATGAPAIQLNTGKGCHLDAHMVGHALEDLPLAPGGLLFIENVGNLVCPAAFDLGEAHKVVVLSVTEGEDKPLKYPEMFAVSDLMLLNKSDLLPHVEFDVGRCLANALKVNPDLQTLVVSARTGEGMPAFYAWIEARAARLAQRRNETAATAATR